MIKLNIKKIIIYSVMNKKWYFHWEYVFQAAKNYAQFKD